MNDRVLTIVELRGVLEGEVYQEFDKTIPFNTFQTNQSGRQQKKLNLMRVQTRYGAIVAGMMRNRGIGVDKERSVLPRKKSKVLQRDADKNVHKAL